MIKQRHQDLILPDIILVKFDETDNWREDIQKKAGKIFGYYLIDRNEITYLAEIRRSYYCHFLYNRVENPQNFLLGKANNKEYSEELAEIENGDNNEQNIYVSEYADLDIIDSYCQLYSKDELKKWIETDGSEAFMESAIEYYQKNQ